MCYSHDTGVHPFRNTQTGDFFLLKLKVIKKIQRTAFGSTEKNLECRTQVDGEVSVLDLINRVVGSLQDGQ